jgi:transcription elongation factor S-II
MTTELLRDSGCGRVLNKLRSKLTGDDKLLASQLLEAWKELLKSVVQAAVAASPQPSPTHTVAEPAVAPSVAPAAASSAATPTADPPATSLTSAAINVSVKTVSPEPTPSSSSAGLLSPTLRLGSTSVVQNVAVVPSVDLSSRKRKSETPIAGAARPEKRTIAAASSSPQSLAAQVSASFAASAYPLPSKQAPVLTKPLPSQDAFFSKPKVTPTVSAAAALKPKPASFAAVTAGPSAPFVRTVSLGNDLRDKIRAQLVRGFMVKSADGSVVPGAAATPSIPAASGTSAVSLEPSSEVREVCALIESELWALCGSASGSGNNGAYTKKAREVLMNLSDSKNPELRSRLLNDDISPHQLITLPFTELASTTLRLAREAAHKWEMAERRSDLQHNVAISDAWRCGKCRERMCTYYQQQTRSADEPMTTFVRCVNCGNRWRC